MCAEGAFQGRADTLDVTQLAVSCTLTGQCVQKRETQTVASTVSSVSSPSLFFASSVMNFHPLQTHTPSELPAVLSSLLPLSTSP